MEEEEEWSPGVTTVFASSSCLYAGHSAAGASVFLGTLAENQELDCVQQGIRPLYSG